MTREEYDILLLNQRIRAYHQAAEPIIRQYSKMLDCYMPQITIWPDGRTETVYPPEVAKLSAQLSELLEQVKKSCGLPQS